MKDIRSYTDKMRVENQRVIELTMMKMTDDTYEKET